MILSVFEATTSAEDIVFCSLDTDIRQLKDSLLDARDHTRIFVKKPVEILQIIRDGYLLFQLVRQVVGELAVVQSVLVAKCPR